MLRRSFISAIKALQGLPPKVVPKRGIEISTQKVVRLAPSGHGINRAANVFVADFTRFLARKVFLDGELCLLVGYTHILTMHRNRPVFSILKGQRGTTKENPRQEETPGRLEPFREKNHPTQDFSPSSSPVASFARRWIPAKAPGSATTPVHAFACAATAQPGRKSQPVASFARRWIP